MPKKKKQGGKKKPAGEKKPAFDARESASYQAAAGGHLVRDALDKQWTNPKTGAVEDQGRVHTSVYPDEEIPLMSLPKFVAQRWKEYGSKVALVDPAGKEISYDALHSLVAKVAAGVAARGVAPGDCVCIIAPNIPHWPVAFHGLAAAGVVVTTANSLYTPRELKHQLNDSGATYVLTVGPFLDRVQAACKATEQAIKEVWTFDGAEGTVPYTSLLTNGATELPDTPCDPMNDTVCLPYSSGTTGLSKGVELTHHNMVANLCQLKPSFGDGQLIEHTLVGFLPFYHIYGNIAIMNGALMDGGTIVTMPKFDLPQFLELIQRHKITILHVVPPVCVALAKHPLIDKYDLSSVQTIFSGAAPLSSELTKALTARLGGVTICQGYGMTELSPASHVCMMFPAKDKDGKMRPERVPAPVGAAGELLPNQECMIVDLITGSGLDFGKEGEICVKGPNVMKGYLNNPDATARTIDSGGWLHTGDIGKVDKDGFMYVTDRLKELIKYKGFQVPPAELEGVLMGDPRIADVACIGVPDPEEEGNEMPRAYITKAAGVSLSAEDCKHIIASQCVGYKKLRGGVEFVAAVPKSAAGKILRKDLKAAYLAKVTDGTIAALASVDPDAAAGGGGGQQFMTGAGTPPLDPSYALQTVPYDVGFVTVSGGKYSEDSGAVLYAVTTTHGRGASAGTFLHTHTEHIRFSQFANLRDKLKRCYDHLQWAHTKQLPPKTMFSSKSPVFVAERAKLLKTFLYTVLTLPKVRDNFVLLHFLGLIRDTELPQIEPTDTAGRQNQAALEFAKRFGTGAVFTELAREGDAMRPTGVRVEDMVAHGATMTPSTNGGAPVRITGQARVVVALDAANRAWKNKVLATCSIKVPPVVLGTSEVVAQTEYLLEDGKPAKCVELLTVNAAGKVSGVARTVTTYGTA